MEYRRSGIVQPGAQDGVNLAVDSKRLLSFVLGQNQRGVGAAEAE